MRIPRSEILARLRGSIDAGVPIIGTGAGTGLSAKLEEAAGVDLIIIYNSGRFRMAGRGSISGLLPIGDANSIVMDMAREVLPVVKRTPVLAGVNGTDPFREMVVFLKQVIEIGFSGVQNYPTVGAYDGRFRLHLEETGYGFDLEVDMIKLARDMDLLTTPYAHTVDEAERMAKAGADVIVAHAGTTIGGLIGASTVPPMDEAVRLVQSIADAAKSIRPEVIVLCHGGPFATPPDVQEALGRLKGVDGFYGASSAERLPSEVAIVKQIKEFKDVRFHQ